jgi:hypothetical protein
VVADRRQASERCGMSELTRADWLVVGVIVLELLVVLGLVVR